MSDMFSWCSSLININLSNFNTNNVTDMSWMFGRCLSLTNINLSNFNTNNVNNMWGMFYGCEKLTKNNVITKDKRILNCYEEAKKDHSYLKDINNEKEIKENCELYLNENKIDFCYKYKFTKEGKNTIKIIFKKPLININCMFYSCNK